MLASRGRSGGSRPQDVVTPLKRGSARKSAIMKQTPDSPIPAPFVKRSITAKKILPRKTLPSHVLAVTRSSPRVSSQAGKENSPRTTIKLSAIKSKSSPGSLVQNETSLSLVQNYTSISDPSVRKSSNKVLSPIPNSTILNLAEQDAALSNKVRRSYSRLEISLHRCSFNVEQSPASQNESSDTSTPNQSRLSRRSFFGFDNLLSQDALSNVSPVTTTSVPLEPGSEVQAETSHFKKLPDTNLPGISMASDLPGISMAKEKRKRRKIPQIIKSDLDEWAAQMNAQFDEAEKFDLFVE